MTITSLFVHHAIPVQPTAISTAATDTSSVLQAPSVVSAPKTVSVSGVVPDKDPTGISVVVAAPVAPPVTAVTAPVVPATVPVVNHTGMLECNDEWIPDCSSGSELVCPNSGSGYCELKSKIDAENAPVPSVTIAAIDPAANTLISLLADDCENTREPAELVEIACNTDSTELVPLIQGEHIGSEPPDWATSQLSKVQAIYTTVNQAYILYQHYNKNDSDAADYAGSISEYQHEMSYVEQVVAAF